MLPLPQKGVIAVTAKEYLSQARKIDSEINDMLEQSTKLRSMATKTTAVLSDMPGSATRNTSKLSDAVIKLMEQEERINSEIDRLVNLRAEIYGVIQEIRDREVRMVLELRYMDYCTWTDIARKLDMSERKVYRLHRRGLKAVNVPQGLAEY